MERSVYEYLYHNLNESEDIQHILKKHNSIASFNTLMSIYSQKYQEHTRKTLHKHRKPHVMTKYFERYSQGEHMLKISEQISVAPCLLARIILQCYLQPYVSEERMKSEVSKRIKDPSLIDDERMRKEVKACIEKDDNYSPFVEKIRRLTGLEHENLLQQKLQEIDMPFMSEEDLRNVGYPKTPDVKLLLPFAVGGFVVNWVESKASFCDDYGLLMAKEQFLGYVNRYGSGLVIYWFGYLKDLNNMTEEGILLLDSFPTNVVFLEVPTITY
eukprot:Phypoly_transcript_03131.p1 GENE.Phypoly_transcript_03131~~Phypoly_transcript_03131.p1  ORF type:complete len:271 (-),score=29.55 Phypoly_transcript_03131:1556-2368(-)